MPLDIFSTPGGDAYSNPFVGAPGPVVNVKVDVSTLTVAEVDTNGYLKPGVPLQANGALVTAAGQSVYGVTIEEQRLSGRRDNANIAADTNDTMIAVATSGTINRDFAESMLGRAYTANEQAALLAGLFKLTTT